MTVSTPHYTWSLPDPGASANTWGNLINGAFTSVDSVVWSILNTDATFTGSVICNGFTNIGGDTVSQAVAGGNALFAMNNSAGTAIGYLYGNTSNQVVLSNTTGGGFLLINTDGSITTNGAFHTGDVTAGNVTASGNVTCWQGTFNGGFTSAGSGSITGNLGVSNNLSCLNLAVNNNINATGNILSANAIYPSNTTTSNQYFLSASSTTRSITWLTPWSLNWRVSDGLMYYQCPAGTMHQWDGNGNYSLGGAGNGFKNGGGPWGSTSDERTKKDIRPYTSGLDQILRINPVAFRYNGQGGTDTSDKVYYGVVAQAVRPVMPELVIEMDQPRHSVEDGSLLPRLATMLEGQLGTDLGPLTLALVNAVKELSARVAELEAR